jgi:hypothetical protein
MCKLEDVQIHLESEMVTSLVPTLMWQTNCIQTSYEHKVTRSPKVDPTFQ